MTDPFNKLMPRRAIGHPFHGLSTSGVLELPNSDTISIGHIPYGPSIVMRHPSPPISNRTALQLADDAAQGKEWRDYALVQYESGHLNGSVLGLNNRIYIDPAGTPWLIEFSFGAFDASLTRAISFTLKSPFGRFSDTEYPPIDRVLDSDTLTFDDSDGSEYPHMRLFTHNETGSAFKSNHYMYRKTTSGIAAIRCNVVIDVDLFVSQRLKKIVTWTITGTGDLNIPTLGDGITGTISVETIPEPQYSPQPPGITRNNHQTDGALPVICAIGGTIDLGVTLTEFTEVIGETYDGNSVNRIEFDYSSEVYRHVDRQLSGCWDCFDPQGDRTAAAVTTLYRKSFATFTWQGVPLASGSYGYQETADDITGSLVVENCIGGGTPNFYDAEAGDPPAPPSTGDPPTTICSIQFGAIWFYPDQSDGVFYAPGPVSGSSALKTSITTPVYVATNPETGASFVSLSDVAYI